MRFYKYNKYFSPLQVYQRYKQSKSALKRPDLNILADSILPANYSQDSSRFYKQPGSKKINVDSFDLHYFYKIVKLVRDRNIKLILFTAPDFFYQTTIYSNYRQVQNEFYTKIKSLEIPHIVPPPLFANNIQYFHDAGHINKYGRFFYTKYFAYSLDSLFNK